VASEQAASIRADVAEVRRSFQALFNKEKPKQAKTRVKLPPSTEEERRRGR
jgi:hypothetical protein